MLSSCFLISPESSSHIDGSRTLIGLRTNCKPVILTITGSRTMCCCPCLFYSNNDQQSIDCDFEWDLKQKQHTTVNTVQFSLPADHGVELCNSWSTIVLRQFYIESKVFSMYREIQAMIIQLNAMPIDFVSLLLSHLSSLIDFLMPSQMIGLDWKSYD